MKYFSLIFSLFLGMSWALAQSKISHSDKRDANMAYNVAVESIKSGNYKSALESLDDALEIHNRFENAYIERAKVKAELGDLEGAFKDITHVLRLNEYLGEAYFVRAFVALKMDFNKVDLYDFDLALNNGYRHPEVYYYEGIYNVLRNKHEYAIENFTAAIQKNPEYIMAYENRAALKRMNADVQGAIYDYEQVILYDSTKHDVLNLLGNAYQLVGNMDGAIDSYTRAIKYSNSLDYLNNRGRAYYFIGSYDEAKNDFQAALAQDESDLSIKCNLANVMVKMNQTKDAVKIYDQIIAKDPKHAVAFLNRGLVKEMQGDLKGACDDWTKAETYGQQKAKEYLSECQKSK